MSYEDASYYYRLAADLLLVIGKFHGEFTEILLDDIQVFREYTGLALRQSCLVWPELCSGLAFRRRAVSRDLSVRNVWKRRNSDMPSWRTQFAIKYAGPFTILGVVLSEDVITRQANFLHNPDQIIRLRSQSALEVKNSIKPRCGGSSTTGAGDVLREPGLDQPARSVGNNFVNGEWANAGRSATTGDGGKHQSSELP